jgi:hypothetical protein
MPHSIRLRGPWEYECPSNAALRGRVPLPGDWPVAIAEHPNFAWRIRRWFHQPTGLEPTSQVVLLVESAAVAVEIALNGTSLGRVATGQTGRFAIHEALLPRNELAMDLVPGLSSGWWSEVRLEILEP